MEYTPYGEKWILDQNDSSKYDMIPYRFTGKEWDEETGLYYMSARYQNPETSRWVSSDPAGWELINPMEKDQNGKFKMRSGFSIVESVNPYSYTGNNPIKYTDPTGMSSSSSQCMNANKSVIESTLYNGAAIAFTAMTGWINGLINIFTGKGDVNVEAGVGQKGMDKITDVAEDIENIQTANDPRESFTIIGQATKEILEDISGSPSFSLDEESPGISIGPLEVTNDGESTTLGFSLGLEDEKTGFTTGAKIEITGSNTGVIPSVIDGTIPLRETLK